MTTKDKSEFRLPGNVVPGRYDITLRPDLESFEFSGFEKIEIDVKEPVSSIKINSAGIRFGEVVVENEQGTSLVGKASPNEETELATITFDGVIGAGRWKLRIEFEGVLSEQLRGFYRSFWKDGDGETHVLASTHFEPTHARRAFPCFDEPEFKATFKITLEIAENLSAISNEVVVSETIVQGTGNGGANLKRIEFEETMLVSTYLVAFCVGEFVASEAVNVNGTQIRIWCTPGKEHLTAYASSVASFAVSFYERYFEIPYPGKKIDHIAIPDFPIGAMENLGCITFREAALLINLETASHAQMVRVANIVMHELAHMWFGDLVTMRWWNGLWLKESFATFMASLCLDAWRPSWNVWNEFAFSRAAALSTDALQTTHAIENPVNHPDEASEMFDVISYEKGCSVLYQLHEFIGAEVFRKGCVAYLKKHQYGNTETHDLWNALEAACRDAGDDTPVRELMDAWVFTTGHPVVTVSETSPGVILLCQRKFQFLPENKSWKLPIPVIMRIVRACGETEIKKLVLTKYDTHVDVGEYESVVVNAGGSGCYRISYFPELQAKLSESGLDKLEIVERFNLVNDTWSMIRAATTSAPTIVELARNLSFETDPNVWEKILGALRRLYELQDEEGRQFLVPQIQEIVQAQVKRLGWETRAEDSIEDRKVRTMLFRTLGTVGGDSDIAARARRDFDNLAKQDPEMVSAIVDVVAYNGDAELFEEFIGRSKAAETPQDEVMYLYALAGFRNEDLLVRAIEMCLSDEVRAQNAPGLFVSAARNESGSSYAWTFFKERMNDMQRLYASTAMARLCAAFSALDTPDQEEDVKAFFATNKVKAGETAVKQMLEQLRVNVLLKVRTRRQLKTSSAG